ncbi:MAG: hypothetical protein AAF790_12940 [Planctomycetota bacterium]
MSAVQSPLPRPNQSGSRRRKTTPAHNRAADRATDYAAPTAVAASGGASPQRPARPVAAVIAAVLLCLIAAVAHAG